MFMGEECVFYVREDASYHQISNLVRYFWMKRGSHDRKWMEKKDKEQKYKLKQIQKEKAPWKWKTRDSPWLAHEDL